MRSTVVNKFNKWLKSVRVKGDFETLPTEFFTSELLGKFGGHLCENINSLDTRLSYMSHFKMAVGNQFSRIEVFTDPEGFIALRSNITKRYFKKQSGHSNEPVSMSAQDLSFTCY